MSLPRADLIRMASELGDAWARFQTPGTREPVDPSIPSQILRFLRTRPAPADVRELLEALPGSSVARLTRSSGPQVQEVVGRLKPAFERLAKQVPELELVEAQAHVLGWAIRVLQNHERGSAQDAKGAGRPR